MSETTQMTRHLLQLVADREGKDVYRTKGKSALMHEGEVEAVEPLVAEGWITIDRSSCPVMPNMQMGGAWAVFTDAGRSALDGTQQGE